MRELRRVCLAVLIPLLMLGSVRPANAQNLLAGAGGGAAGVAAGAYVTLTIVVAQARAGQYVLGLDDFLGWRSTPVLIGGGTGLMLGLFDPPRLWDGVVWGLVGTGVGTGVGLVLGPMIWDDRSARWAGGAIGAGGGMVAGALFGLLVKGGQKDGGGSGSAAAVPIVIRIPVR